MGEFGERGGDPQVADGFGSEFVVAAAQILQEGVAGDHYLRCPISLKSAHRTEPALSWP